ncbi:MAG: hypothetical protein ACU83N_15050 [Gammaproteobacteria bacterium]
MCILRKHARQIILYSMALLNWCAPISAQQALVRSYDAPALSIGQALIMHYGEQCLAVFPEHVADEAGIPAFLLEGRQSILGEAESVDRLSDDIAVARLTGRITKQCGYSITSMSRAIDRTLQGQGLGTLRSVNGDGTIANMAVTLVDNDGQTFLRVQPSNQSKEIRKGQSGSLLMVNNKPVGMLLAVNAHRGVGKLIRLDVLLERVEAHMASTSSKMAAVVPPRKATENLASSIRGASVIGWSTPPIDSSHLTANLVADEAAPAWRSRADRWPVEVEIDLADDKVVIDSITLDGDGVTTAELPKRVEIFVNISSDAERWRSLASRDVAFDDKGIATFTFAPSWARQIKMAVWSVQGKGDIVGLKRIRVHGP